MTGRVSARSSVNRDLASSPPRRSGRRGASKSQSPVVTTRPSRSTRSASRELGENDAPVAVRRSGRRNAREPSVESIGSNTSLESNAPAQTVTRATLGSAPELSIVQEDLEDEEGGEDNAEENQETQGTMKNSQSPGGMSNMSGTTALSSYSAQEMAGLKTETIVELLPELWTESQKIMRILAPKQSPPQFTELLAKQLQIPGSDRANQLKFRENIYESVKMNFGSDVFINVGFVLRKLFKDNDPGEGNYRPDVILHAANIATLIKSTLLLNPEHPNTMSQLQRLDEKFPFAFMSSFGEKADLGQSALSSASFELALEIRTQTAISVLAALKSEPGYDPDQLLAQIFFNLPERRDQTLSAFEDSVQNGPLRPLAGLDLDETLGPDEQSEMRVRVQVAAIRDHFNRSPEALKEGDYVDFESLREHYPWVTFLKMVVQWSNMRLAEINTVVDNASDIQQALMEELTNMGSPIRLDFDPPEPIRTPTRQPRSKSTLLPAAEIRPATKTGQSLYTGPASALNLLQRSKQASGSGNSAVTTVAGSSTQVETPRNQGFQIRKPSTAPAKTSRRLISEEEFESNAPPSTQEYISMFHAQQEYKNKENRNPPPQGTASNAAKPKKKMYDRQEGAVKVQWETQDDYGQDQSIVQRGKRAANDISGDDTLFVSDNDPASEYEETVEEEEELSEDEGYEEDKRQPDAARRLQAPTNPSRPPVAANERSPKRVRYDNNPESTAERVERERAESELQASAQDAADEDDEEYPPPTYQEINVTAKAITAATGRPPLAATSLSQTRTPWSLDDTNTLIGLIGKHGCRWSSIQEIAGDSFQRSVDQVGLKDKARNIKVDYLKAGVALPIGFNGVKLGLKEKRKVLAVGQNPYRRENELPGDEMYDMEGKLIDK